MKKTGTQLAHEEVDEAVSETQFTNMMNRGERAFKYISMLFAIAVVLYFIRFGLPFLFSLPESLQVENPSVFLLSQLGGPGEWGTFGDFLGGLLNPAVGVATVYLVLMNVRMQKRELGYALKEMKNSNSALDKQNAAIEVQNFQNTFFNWLSTYRDLVNKVELSLAAGRHEIIHGTLAMKRIYLRAFTENGIRVQLTEDGLSEHAQEVINREPISTKENAYVVERSLLTLWRKMCDDYEDRLDPMLRSVLGLIRWIVNRNNSLPKAKKREYLEILSSQLSPIELTYILLETVDRDLILLGELRNYGFFMNLPVFNDFVLCYIITHGHYADDPSE